MAICCIMATTSHCPTIPTSIPLVSSPTEYKCSSVTFQKKIGQLARLSQHTDPHSPVWVPGLNYPVQYVVRQTRSMMASNKTDKNNNNGDDNEDIRLVVSISLSQVVRTSCSADSSHSWSHVIFPDVNKLRQLLKPLDFFLPDKTFLKLKLDKLKEIDKLKSNTSLTDATGESTSVITSLSRAVANHNVDVFNEDYSNTIQMPSGMPTITDIRPNATNAAHPICSVFEFKMQSVNNNHRLFSSKPLRSGNTLVWSLPHTSTSTLELYCNEALLGTIRLSSVNEVEVELVYVDIKQVEVFACVSDSKQCWVYIINTNKLTMDQVFHEQFVDCRRECTVSQPGLSCRHWLLHTVGVVGHDELEDAVIISFRNREAIITFHMKKMSSQWSLSLTVVLPQSSDVESCCTCEGLSHLLLGLSNQKYKIMIWDTISSCLVNSYSISCQPLPSSFPLAILVHAGKIHGKSTDTVINVVICLSTTPTIINTSPPPSSPLPIGWLVSCNTTNGHCQCTLSYNLDTPTMSDAIPCPSHHVVDHCFHGDYHSLLFSDDRVSCWNINQPNPVLTTQLIKRNSLKGLC